MSKLLDEREFFTYAITELHNFAGEKGLAKNGLVLIPELLQEGQGFVLDWFKNQEFQNRFGQDRVSEYYYNLMAFALYGGIAYAAQWHEDYSEIKNGNFAEKLYQDGILETARPVIKHLIPMTDEEWNEFVEELYIEKWIEIHKPYWALSDCRGYTYNLNLAFFMLGVSICLDKLGY